MSSIGSDPAAFGRFTYSVLLPAVRDDLRLSNSLAGFLGTVNVAAYLLGTLLVVLGLGGACIWTPSPALATASVTMPGRRSPALRP